MTQFVYFSLLVAFTLSAPAAFAKSRCPERYLKIHAENELLRREPNVKQELYDFQYKSTGQHYSYVSIETDGYSYNHGNFEDETVDIFSFKSRAQSKIRIYALFVSSRSCTLRAAPFLGPEKEPGTY